MRGELVTTITADRVRLHGFLMDADPLPHDFADAAVISHGLAGNFYSSSLLLEMASRLNRIGIATVIGNSRGHDFLNWTLRSGTTSTLGAAVEDVDECRFDVNGWAQYLVRQGFKRILLVGHSLGAIKSLYAQAWQPDSQAVGVVAVSPTRLNSDQFLESPGADQFRRTLVVAQELVKAGEPDRLMQVEFPFPTWMSAIAYLNKYGHENRFDWFGFIDRVDVPVAIYFGERELNENAAFDGLDAAMQTGLSGNKNVHRETIPDADHFYVASMDALCERMEAWIDGQGKLA